ncbi:UDP-glycosyltransferase UGT4-like [Homalodisca vitripennis]|uniref:UDP-glycosyltransferase UGT4-like n=1 Tax=Homalodisca vitripennis TaxID=197043 RepID=UPI001EECDDB5|nr:UDP-glycosyltransferase UGT4-like [Homalodisca vitripennis]XP_046683128.1 UDP-glycosyltransferase UGT4-like [Homalodisca vitripennis]XP_046683129.1 UDP-glycosyltransferase UGT4-like [Homalodisca vitripennis]XP_046683130.1 UDP-glycosyltransferase UGT4-like [Homalodisca vitripennis]
MWMPLLSCVLLLCAINSAYSARILAILPLPSKSHFISNQAVLAALAARGHHVTVYSMFTPSQPVANMKHIELRSTFLADMKKTWTFEKFTDMVKQDSYIKCGALTIWQLSSMLCTDFLNQKEIKTLIASKEKFDLVMTEALFGQESMLAFGHIFNAPVINLNGFGAWSIVNRVHGNPLQLATAPDIVSYPFKNEMNFVDRFKNVVTTTMTLLYYHFIHLPKQQEIIKDTFKMSTIPPIEKMLQNLSLTIANFHHLVSCPRSYTGNIIPVGGIHIPQQLPPIPKDIKEFLDSGKKSVILFSLGTVVPVHLMPSEYIQMFINVFRKLPYKILWKTEAEGVTDLPKNVMITKWLPQQSVLAHPNCVLFITHGGLMSQLEVFHMGVPVVAIPFFGDQPFNVGLYEHFGVGVKLDFNSLTEDSLNKAVLSVVGKPQYIENAKKVSQLFRHLPMSANDTAVFWTEYVLRYGGAQHLTPHAAQMPWYQLALIDVAAVILAVVFVFLYILKKVFSLLGYLCCSKKTAPNNKKAVSSKKKNN